MFNKIGCLISLVLVLSLTGSALALTVNVKTDLGPLGIYDSNAAGDGVTDDTNAIQAAIDYVVDQNGGTVYCPTSTYVVLRLHIYNTVDFAGDGRDSTIFRPAGDAYCMMDVHGGTIRDFTAYGNDVNNSGNNWVVGEGGPTHIIQGHPADDNGATIKNVYALEAQYDPLYVRESHNLRVVDSEFERAGRNIVSIVGPDEHFEFINCRFGTLYGLYHVDIEPTSDYYVRYGIFLNCDFDCTARGSYSGTNDSSNFLVFKGFDSEGERRNVVVLGSVFDEVYVRVNKIFVHNLFALNTMDGDGVSIFKRDASNPVGEFHDTKVRGNDFIGVSTWDDVTDDVTFSGTSKFQENTPSWANDDSYTWPEPNYADLALLHSEKYLENLDFNDLMYLCTDFPKHVIDYVPEMAWYPTPADTTTDVNVNAVLTWEAGWDANSHDVYFGTSSSAVNDANTSTTGIYKGNQESNSYDPGTMATSTTYYWRIDEVNEAESTVTKGDVWSFTTSAPAPAEYTERFEELTIATSGTWLTQSLSAYGVPANAVVEIGLKNSNPTAERDAGVRAVGSSLDRTHSLQEAEDGGWDMVTMHVQANGSSEIQLYGADTIHNDFYLLGWWNTGTYVEKSQELTLSTGSTWVDKDLSSYGVGANQYCEIVIRNTDGSNENWIGVRKNGSSIDRTVQLHEAEDGGRDCATMVVQADASGVIEMYNENPVRYSFYLVGYWTTPPGTYTEKFVDVGKPTSSSTWQDKDLSSYGVPANAVCEMNFANGRTTAENLTGVRVNGSSLSRLFNLHESEAGGRDMGRMHVTADANSIIEEYFQNVAGTGEFNLVGYWQ